VEQDLFDYPYDFTDIKLDLLLENKTNIHVETEDGNTYIFKTDFRLLKSFDMTNILAIKSFDNVDNMDSHDFGSNMLS